jgi:hypothetical protein
MTRIQLIASLRLWERRLKLRRRKHNFYHNDSKRSVAERQQLATKWHKLVIEAERMVSRRRKQLAKQSPMRVRALNTAEDLIGVMEVGGNNMGKKVLEIIRANGGWGPEPWCGDFCAHCYRRAGSKVVQRAWAAVVNIGFLTGMSKVKSPLAGDLVCFKFDHVGIYVKDLGGGWIETIEGNTGRAGAVSDSRTGGDGVYRKRRSKTQVSRYVRVHR